MILLLSSNFWGIDNFQAKWQSMSIFAKCGERTLSWDIIIIEIGNDNISHQSPNIWRCIASLVWRESTSPKMVNPLRHSIRSILWKLLEIWKNLERIIYIGIPEKTGFKVVKLREDLQIKRDALGLFAESPLTSPPRPGSNWEPTGCLIPWPKPYWYTWFKNFQNWSKKLSKSAKIKSKDVQKMCKAPRKYGMVLITFKGMSESNQMAFQLDLYESNGIFRFDLFLLDLN